VEVRIGIVNAPRELAFETSQSPADVEQLVANALESKAAHVTLQDDKGNRFLVPIGALAYVQIGTEESRRVGFVA